MALQGGQLSRFNVLGMAEIFMVYVMEVYALTSQVSQDIGMQFLVIFTNILILVGKDIGLNVRNI